MLQFAWFIHDSRSWMGQAISKLENLTHIMAAVTDRAMPSSHVSLTGLSPKSDRRWSFAIVAPRHPDGADWPWLSQVEPMRRHVMRPIYIENTFPPFPKATRLYRRWQHLRARRAVAASDLAFIFSTDIVVGVTRWPAGWLGSAKLVYVGFTQDGDWSPRKVETLRKAMQQYQAVTVFSRDERTLYLERFGMAAERLHVIPIHTDEFRGYEQYSSVPPSAGDYVLSLGSPNRRFMPVARACKALKVPLVIITRPGHAGDSLDELASLGAQIITNADRMRSLSYLKHAKFAAMCFQTDQLPGAFTTLIHGMFMRTPSVVTNCLGMRDYVEHGENGLVAAHGDEAALTAAIDRLWNEPGLAQRLGNAAHARAQRLHSLEAAAQSFARLGDCLLAEG